MEDRKITRLDNFPPSPIIETDPDILQARLDRDYRAMVDRFVELELGAAKVPAITSESQAERVLGWITKQCGQLIVDAERAHKTEKAPYLAGTVVDRFFNPRIKSLKDKTQAIRTRIESWRRAKEMEVRRREAAERAAAEKVRQHAEAEAARLAAEAKAAEAAGNRRTAVELTREAQDHVTDAAMATAVINRPPEQVVVRGEYGGTAFGVESYNYEVVDPALVPEGYKEISDKAVREAMAEGIRVIPGIRIFRVTKGRIKRC